MGVMTAQAPLPLAPADAVHISPAAALAEDADGGRVYIHGELSYVWDAADQVGRRHAAVSLVRIKAAKPGPVATAFAVSAATLWRWRVDHSADGAAGLVAAQRGPKGPSKLTPALVADIRSRREQRESLRSIAAAVGVSEGSVRLALAKETADAEEAENETGEPADGADDAAGADAEEQADEESDVADTGQAHDGDASDAGDKERGCGLPDLADPADRTAERALARWRLIGHAGPVFTPAGRVPLAGLFLAFPALEATGLLACAHGVYGSLPRGFYGLDTVLTEAVARALAGESRAEGASRIDPVALGRILGLDRAPEVKTIRRKLAQLANHGSAEELVAGMARHHLHQADQADPDLAAVLYVDGHTRAYHGTRRIAKTHVARLRFPAPATVETWVCDAEGAPVLVVMAEPGASLAAELRRLLPQLRETVGDNRRVLVGFDRGGWSPALFAQMHAAGFDVLTWRKAPVEDVPDEKFRRLSFTDETGRRHVWDTAETTVDLPVDDKGTTFTMRQITRRDHPDGKQVHILTTRSRRKLSTRAVNYRISNRWREENFFRYARIHYDLDSLDSYQVGADDPGRSVPNPAKKQAQKQVAAARARYERQTAHADAALLQLHTPASGEVRISNADHNAATAEARAAEDALTAAEETNQATPARLPLGQVNPGQQILEVQTKLLSHAVKIAAYNTTAALARDLRIHTGYARATDEAHTLIRQVLTHTGDIDPDPAAGTLTIRLDPLPTPRATRAVAELCEHLTATKTRYPGTDLVLRYQIKPKRH